MNFTGCIKGISQDWETGQWQITVSVNEPGALHEVNNITNCEKLAIEIEEYKEIRSINANKTLWLCLSRIAQAMNPPVDKWEVYLQMLKRYGKFTYICVKPNVVDAVKAQWRESEVIGEIEINGQKAVQMLCYFGSSLMNTKEFSVLLDGVISEMKEMGLQTPTPEEFRRVIEEWERQHGKKAV